MSTAYIVNGAGNGVYPRLEIADLMKDEFQFSLFMQAMSRIQSKDYQPKPASWQEIGGIHGLPYTQWSGDPQGPKDDENPEGWGGYCYHASVLFPPWHRVLMLLVEQAVCNEARAISSTINQNSNVGADEQAKWSSAAEQLRFPFWDWSAPEVQSDGLPAIFETPSVDVRGPGGTKITLDHNPIQSYRFHPIPDGATNDSIAGMQVKFRDWTQTYRWATVQHGQTKDNVQELNTALKNGAEIQGVDFTSDSKIRQKLGHIFSFPQKAPKELWATYWDYFSNTSPQSSSPPGAATIAPIEEPHNWVHLTIGGDGDMAFNDLAAFDPIFFFHHCNVDRLYALWEYVYPDYWLGKGYYDDDGNLAQFVDQQGTYQEQPGTALTEDSQLAPFRKADGSYWTPADVRGLQPGQGLNKYYSYPPLLISTTKDGVIAEAEGPGPGQETGPTELGREHAAAGMPVIIDVTKPASPADRAVYLAALQQYYGDSKLAQKSHPVAKPPIFNSPAISLLQKSSLPPASTESVKAASVGVANVAAAPHVPDVQAVRVPPAPTKLIAPPPTHEPVSGFRDFVVTGALPQFAFRGSHRLKLHLDGTHVANLSVLSRLDPARCANCEGRIASGRTHVRGVMALPHAHVVGLLEKHGLNREDASDEEVIELLKKHISAQIVNPVGTVLAEAAHGPSADVPEGHPVFKAEDHPVLQLHSSRVFLSTPHHRQPRIHEGWIHHGAVLKDQWQFSQAA